MTNCFLKFIICFLMLMPDLLTNMSFAIVTPSTACELSHVQILLVKLFSHQVVCRDCYSIHVTMHIERSQNVQYVLERNDVLNERWICTNQLNLSIPHICPRDIVITDRDNLDGLETQKMTTTRHIHTMTGRENETAHNQIIFICNRNTTPQDNQQQAAIRVVMFGQQHSAVFESIEQR